MKYLAILKDSFREAVDTKVFYFMLGLSCLLVLLIGSVSFRPVTLEEELTRLTDQLTFFSGLASQGRAPRWTITEFDQTNWATEPWNADYQFKFCVQLPDAREAETAKGQMSELVHSVLRQRFAWLKDVRITDTKSADPKEILFSVSTHGTKITQVRDWLHKPSLFFGALPMGFFTEPLGELIHFIEDGIFGTVGAAAAMLVSTIITAFFIPNMLRKGSVDLLLAKPIHRSTLLIYKFNGGLSFMFLNTVVVVLGVWLVLGLQSGLWPPGFLLTVLILTFEFAIFYAVSTLLAVLSRSAIVAILVTCFVWLVLSVVGWTYRYVNETRLAAGVETGAQAQSEMPLPPWAYLTVDAIHFVLPRMKDLDALTTKAVVADLLPPDSEKRKQVDKAYASISWVENLSVSGAFIALMLGLACWRFASKDY